MTVKEFKYKGKRYQLDSLALVRLIQTILRDTQARFSRGDKEAVSHMLDDLIHKLGDFEARYDVLKHEEEQAKDKDAYQPSRILFDMSLSQFELSGLLLKLRRIEPFPITDIYPDGGYGDIPVTVDGQVTVLFDDTDTVHVRAFLLGDILPKTVIQATV